MDFDLTDEQPLIKQTAREFTDKEIVPGRGQNSRNHHFDIELVAKIADQGYLGAIVPREYGGAGPGLRHLRDRLRGDRARLLGHANRHLGADLARLLDDPASGAPRSRSSATCRSCARASGWGASGSPSRTPARTRRTRRRARSSRTTAWKINGAKMWISLGNHAKLALVFAQTDPDSATRAWRASSSRPTSPASSPRRSRARWACGPPTRPRSRSTTCRRPRLDAR